MKTLKTLAKLSKEIPDDFRVQFRLMGANLFVKYDRGKETFLRDTDYVEDISELNLNEIKTLTLE